MSEPQYEAPPRAVPENDAGYFEKITQAVFQAAYFFFWSVGEDVPEYHEWRAQQEK